MLGGECHECGNEYKKLRQHWAMSDCEASPEKQAKVEVECRQCGEKYTEWQYRVDENSNSFCSNDCLDEYRREGKYCECDWCGKEVYVSPTHLKDKHHFCDRNCSKKWRSEAFSKEGHPQWDGGKDEYECEECGDVFKRYSSTGQAHKYCSVQCRNRSALETRQCDSCGEDITRPSNRFRGERAFCSGSCYQDWMSEFQRGSQNPAWKGGKYGIAAVRRMIGQQSWDKTAREVRAGAGHVCQKCGCFQPHRKLSVHHIIPVVSGGTNEHWNLMPLCESCHSDVETYTKQYTDPHLLKYV
jgi:hypothetical protein